MPVVPTIWPPLFLISLASASGVDRHLQADHGGLAAGGPRPGQRLLGADLEGLGGTEGRAPRRRDQHHGADRATAPADEPPARELAAIPDVFSPLLFFPLLAHWFPSWLFRPSGIIRTDPLDRVFGETSPLSKRDIARGFNRIRLPAHRRCSGKRA